MSTNSHYVMIFKVILKYILMTLRSMGKIRPARWFGKLLLSYAYMKCTLWLCGPCPTNEWVLDHDIYSRAECSILITDNSTIIIVAEIHRSQQYFVKIIIRSVNTLCLELQSLDCKTYGMPAEFEILHYIITCISVRYTLPLHMIYKMGR